MAIGYTRAGYKYRRAGLRCEACGASVGSDEVAESNGRGDVRLCRECAGNGEAWVAREFDDPMTNEDD